MDINLGVNLRLGRHQCAEKYSPMVLPIMEEIDTYIHDAMIHNRLQTDLATHIFYNPINVDDYVADAVGPYDDVSDSDLEINDDLDDKY
ncbi:hypothetical protein LXL04_022298 [Taraxacum kok-saghyz]